MLFLCIDTWNKMFEFEFDFVADKMLHKSIKEMFKFEFVDLKY